MMNNALKLIAVVIALVGFYTAPAMAGGTLSMTNAKGETVRVSMKELMDLKFMKIL